MTQLLKVSLHLRESYLGVVVVEGGVVTEPTFIKIVDVPVRPP